MTKRFAAVLTLFVLLLAPQFVRAETPPATDMPSNEFLITAWEQAQRKNPQIKTFEKTADPTIYNVEMGIFPYKGRLKVLNGFVETSPYYEMEEEYVPNAAASYTGVVETDLLDAPPDFEKKFASSLYVWEKSNKLFFDKKAGEWVTSHEWRERAMASQKAAMEAAKANSTCGRPVNTNNSSMTKELIFLLESWGPLILIIGFFIVIARRQNRRVWAIQDKLIAMSTENLDFQRQNTQLLRDILSALQRK